MNAQKLRSALAPFAALALLLVLAASCSRGGEGSLKLQANPILSGGLGWAVVKDAYVRLKEKPSESSRDLDHLRRGGVFRLDAREIGSRDASSKSDEREIWYGIVSEGAKGWVRDFELDIFLSQAQADKAASAYK
jgi:hypothetical protein